MVYRPLVPGIFVVGNTMRVFTDALTSFPVLREAIFETLGVDAVRDGEWYPQESVLRAYQKVDSLLGGRGLERFGKQVPPLVALPPTITDVHALLSQVDAVYHTHHRRDGAPMLDPDTGRMLEGIGHYHYTRLGERAARVVCDDPYPCRFDVGLCHGFVRRFAATSTVVHETDDCRLHGDPACVYRVSW